MNVFFSTDSNHYSHSFIIKFICRTTRIGVQVSLDYYWSLKGLEDGTAEYELAMSAAHQRSADSILQGCMENGGLYIKAGQGLVSLNHILPPEYLETLKVTITIQQSDFP